VAAYSKNTQSAKDNILKKITTAGKWLCRALRGLNEFVHKHIFNIAKKITTAGNLLSLKLKLTVFKDTFGHKGYKDTYMCPCTK